MLSSLSDPTGATSTPKKYWTVPRTMRVMAPTPLRGSSRSRGDPRPISMAETAADVLMVSQIAATPSSLAVFRAAAGGCWPVSG